MKKQFFLLFLYTYSTNIVVRPKRTCRGMFAELSDNTNLLGSRKIALSIKMLNAARKNTKIHTEGIIHFMNIRKIIKISPHLS